MKTANLVSHYSIQGLELPFCFFAISSKFWFRKYSFSQGRRGRGLGRRELWGYGSNFEIWIPELARNALQGFANVRFLWVSVPSIWYTPCQGLGYERAREWGCSLPRVMNFKVCLKLHQKYYIGQYEELWLFIAYSEERWLYCLFSQPIYTFLLKGLGECAFWACEWKRYENGGLEVTESDYMSIFSSQKLYSLLPTQKDT